jgi:glycosyltransferase involved in cell wall biosynthesis
MVSAIVPARNEEASIARAVDSLAEQKEIGEVIVVNDQSADRTGEVLAELALRTPKLRVLRTDSLPSGWTGKNYALSVGAAVATGKWLLFTDADTFHLPGSTARALADAAETDAALVSYSPEQELGTFWERALIPPIFWMLSRKYSFANVSDAGMPDAAANGQFILIRRALYTALGGQTGVAGEILEDVALARRVKGAGHRLFFTGGHGIVRTRMYRSFGAMWEGWTKNLYPLVGRSKSALLGEFVDLIALTAVILLLTSHPLTEADRIMLGAGILFLAGRLIGYGVFLRRNLFPLSLIQYYVPGMCLYWGALAASWWKNTRGTVTWKGRAYRRPATSYPERKGNKESFKNAT